MARHRANRSSRIDAWLAQGGVAVAANERAARSLMRDFDAARRVEGLLAWPKPAIHSWESWVRGLWLERNDKGLMPLNSVQELALWTRIIGRSRAGAGLVRADRVAAQAQRAHRLLADYAPEEMKRLARAGAPGWTGDAAVFGEWLRDFDAICRGDSLASAATLGSMLTAQLRQEADSARPPLLLVGFDRLLGTQKTLLEAWGQWELDLPGNPAESTHFFWAEDESAELAACVAWLRGRLEADPRARLIVVTTALNARRGALERALMQAPQTGAERLRFEFSLGVPLTQVGLAHAALLLLRWLSESPAGALSEAELDWLISSGNAAATAEEELRLAETMRALRQRGQQRMEWKLDAFLGPELFLEPEDSILASGFGEHPPPRPPADWSVRISEARRLLRGAPPIQSPSSWAALAAELLTRIGWPGFRPLGSEAFQARKRWEQALETCASLGFDGTAMDWAEFLSAATEAAGAAIFAAESTDPSILVTEPLESAGQCADGIWFLGANETDWPGRGAPNPLLPIALQRETGMPHATAQADWDLAAAATGRILSSAAEVVFSFARMAADGEARPSRMAAQRLGSSTPLPNEFARTPAKEPRLETLQDLSRIPFPLATMEGGSATLTRQSLCPFQAFATTRLSASKWDPAEAGLTAQQRGLLLHAVLHQVWSGPARGGLAMLDDLRALLDVESFVGQTVRSVLKEKLPATLRETLPPRFLDLEARRLTRLVTAWLAYERERQPFIVAATEVKSTVTVAGLTLVLRLDRVDVLADGSALVIDYKTGSVGPDAWEGDRPDDVQLPLYATFASLEPAREQRDDRVQGLVFARLRAGEVEFSGRARDAAGQLLGGLGPNSSLVRYPLTDGQLEDWRGLIARLGEDYLRGKADVNPKDGLKTCERCHLQAVCRIYGNLTPNALEAEGAEDSDA